MHIAHGLETADLRGFIGADSKGRLTWNIGVLERLRMYHEGQTGNVQILAKIRAALFELYALTA